MVKSEKKNDILKKIKHDSTLTSFQKKVLKTVLCIPRGEVRSYKWVAERSGSPRSYRAVGTALNKNPYAPEVPCHRVIASDGSIGGYAKGVKEKIKLLRKEQVVIK